MGHERLLPSFETPRKSARLLRMTAVYVERLSLVGTSSAALRASDDFAHPTNLRPVCISVLKR
jgi:hypothetical protein